MKKIFLKLKVSIRVTNQWLTQIAEKSTYFEDHSFVSRSDGKLKFYVGKFQFKKHQAHIKKIDKIRDFRFFPLIHRHDTGHTKLCAWIYNLLVNWIQLPYLFTRRKKYKKNGSCLNDLAKGQKYTNFGFYVSVDTNPKSFLHLHMPIWVWVSQNDKKMA